MRELLDRFVPVADEVYRLQNGEEADCLLFQSFAEQGHYGGRTEPSRTRQGIYAVTPSGRFLASCNTRSADAMKEMLRRALEQWGDLSEEERLGRAPVDRRDARDQAELNVSQISRWERRYPEDGLVLKVYTRDLPEQPTYRDWHRHAWNQDFLWFRADEMTGFVPKRALEGERFAVDRSLVERIARTSLVDNVRGQTPCFSADQVQFAELQSTVAEVNGDRMTLQLEGSTHTQSGPPGEGHGVAVKLLGTAIYDRSAGRFTSFELVALGERWGTTRFNERRQQLEPSAIGYVITLAGEEPGERVAPAGIWHYGW